MQLDYLDFDYSEDAEGHGTFDAMTSVLAHQLGPAQAEIVAVLAWAHQEFQGACGAQDEGGEWQYDLQGVQEIQTPLSLHFDASENRLDASATAPLPPRTTISLTIGGSASFCAALREQFGID